jgi:hypothetical protein
MTIATLERVFRIGTMTLPFPDNATEPSEALAFFEPNFPFIKNSVIGEPFIEAGRQVFEVIKAPVKTNG